MSLLNPFVCLYKFLLPKPPASRYFPPHLFTTNTCAPLNNKKKTSSVEEKSETRRYMVRNVVANKWSQSRVNTRSSNICFTREQNSLGPGQKGGTIKPDGFGKVEKRSAVRRVRGSIVSLSTVTNQPGRSLKGGQSERGCR